MKRDLQQSLVCIIFILFLSPYNVQFTRSWKLTATINSPVVSIIGLQMFSGPDTLFDFISLFGNLAGVICGCAVCLYYEALISEISIAGPLTVTFVLDV